MTFPLFRVIISSLKAAIKILEEERLKKALIILCMFAIWCPLLAKTPEELIEQTARETLSEYTKPLVTSFGTAIGSDFIDRRHHGLLGFDFGIKLVWVSVPEEMKTTTYSIGFGDTIWLGEVAITDTVFEGNTIFGDTLPVEGDPLGIPGLGFPGVFFAVPQANVGLTHGLNASIRWCPFSFEETSGQILGVGLKYATSDMLPIPLFSFNLIAGAGYQYVKFGDIVTATSINGAIIAKFGISPPMLPLSISPFVGVGIEKSNMRFKYSYDDIKIDERIDGDNSYRTILGLGVNALVFNIDLTYNIGKMNNFGLGIGIGLR